MNQWQDEKTARATMQGRILTRHELHAWVEERNARERAWWRWPVGLLCVPVLALREVVRIVREGR
jgi:hypothetical protein